MKKIIFTFTLITFLLVSSTTSVLAATQTISVTLSGSVTDPIVPSMGGAGLAAGLGVPVTQGGTSLTGPGPKVWTWGYNIGKNLPCVGAVATSVRASTSISGAVNGSGADFIQVVALDGTAMLPTRINSGSLHSSVPTLEVILRGEYSNGPLPVNGTLDASYSLPNLSTGSITISAAIDSDETSLTPSSISNPTVYVDFDDSACDLNASPVATDDTVSTSNSTAVTISPITNDTDTDGDTLSLEGTPVVVGGSAVGTITISGNQIIFTPANGFVGTAEIQYSINDGNGGVSSASIFVIVSSSVTTTTSTMPTTSTSNSPTGTLPKTGSLIESELITVVSLLILGLILVKKSKKLAHR